MELLLQNRGLLYLWEVLFGDFGDHPAESRGCISPEQTFKTWDRMGEWQARRQYSCSSWLTTKHNVFSPINLCNVYLLDRLMACYFSQDSSIPTTHNQHLSGWSLQVRWSSGWAFRTMGMHSQSSAGGSDDRHLGLNR